MALVALHSAYNGDPDETCIKRYLRQEIREGFTQQNIPQIKATPSERKRLRHISERNLEPLLETEIWIPLQRENTLQTAIIEEEKNATSSRAIPYMILNATNILLTGSSRNGTPHAQFWNIINFAL